MLPIALKNFLNVAENSCSASIYYARMARQVNIVTVIHSRFFLQKSLAYGGYVLCLAAVLLLSAWI